MFRSTGRRCVFALISGAMLVAVATAGAADVKDPTEIIRSLAPLEYLPEHSGGFRRPAIDLTIPFALNSAKLKHQARAQLQALGEALASEKLRGRAIEIAGHTDSTGPADYNRRLSERRAQAVADFLVTEFGFDAARFRVVGHGEDEPKNPLLPGAAQNRRVEISVIAGSIGKATAASASEHASVPARYKMSATSGIDLRTQPAAAEALKAKAGRDGSVRIIVGLAALGALPDVESGWQNLNDHIRGLQNRALNSLGWVNFNDLVRFDYTPAMAMSVDSNRLDELLTSNAVTQVFEDARNTFSLSRSGTIIGLGSGEGAPRYGEGVSVAIIDTGVDGDHPFLSGRVIAEACFSFSGQTEGTIFHSACPSGEEQEFGAGAARPCALERGCDHGTHVAGIVAGAGDAFTGVAAAADIVAVQVSTIIESEDCGEAGFCASPFDSNIIRALEWVYRNREQYRIAAVNLSLGSGSYRERCDYSPLGRIFLLLRQAGVVAVASSGNSGFENSMGSPACLSEVVSVGATTYADTVAPFSNSSAYLDFLAPGTSQPPFGRQSGILSSVPGNLFERVNGTSMAAPHVAGAFAALKSAVPNATVDEMIEAVRQSGQPVQDSRTGLTRPRLRVDAAIETLRLMVSLRPVEPKPELQPEPKTEVKPEPEPKSEAKPEPEPKTEAKPEPEPEPEPKSEAPPARDRERDNIGGIIIEQGRDAVGADGAIEW